MKARPGLAALTCAGILVLTACAPQSPDHPAWREKADQTLSDVASNAATARLLLQQLQAHQVYGNFAQVGVLESETNAGTATSKFTAVQPEPADDKQYKQVSTVLSDADDLLSQVRIAVVRRNSAAYPA